MILNTTTAVYIGIVYSYLPFMVLPIYAKLEKHDPTLIEAAAGPRLRAVARLLEGHRPAVAAGHHRRLAPVFIPSSASSSSPICSAAPTR